MHFLQTILIYSRFFQILQRKFVIKIEQIRTTNLRQLRLGGISVPCEHFVKRTRNLFLRKFVKGGFIVCGGRGYNVFNKVLKINQVFAGFAKI